MADATDPIGIQVKDDFVDSDVVAQPAAPDREWVQQPPRHCFKRKTIYNDGPCAPSGPQRLNMQTMRRGVDQHGILYDGGGNVHCICIYIYIYTYINTHVDGYANVYLATQVVW